VTGKGRRSERLPLPADAGEAVAAYLSDGRPRPFEDARNVFLRTRAPHRRLTSTGVSQAVFAAGQRAGIEGVFAHRLRHTAATEMLRAGASLPEVGQLLRHRRLLSTAIYAKPSEIASDGRVCAGRLLSGVSQWRCAAGDWCRLTWLVAGWSRLVHDPVFKRL
jgi:site-specific recombinase XerD